MLTVGNVTIDQNTGAETIDPGLAADLYAARKAATKLPNTTAKRGCTATASASAGATSIAVNDTSGYTVGEVLGEVLYVSGVEPAQAVLTITGIPDGTHFTFSPALPVGSSILSGAQFGFRGTLAEWQAEAVPTLVKILTPMAAQAVGDATAIIGHFSSFAEVIVAGSVTAHISTSQGGLQRTPTPNNPNTPTVAPSAAQDIPLQGTGTIQ